MKDLRLEEVRRVQRLLNYRPRKALGYRTPTEASRTRYGASKARHTGGRKCAEKEEFATRMARASRNDSAEADEIETNYDPPAFVWGRTADPLTEMLGCIR